MPVRKLFCTDQRNDWVLEVCIDSGGCTDHVGIMIRDISDPYAKRTQRGYMSIRPEEIPALCAELRKMAKLAKQANIEYEAKHGTRY